MTAADRISADARAAVSAWPSLSPEDRDLPEVAVITPHAEMAELSWRGVDRFFDTVFDALDQVEALGIPAERVRVLPFRPTAVLTHYCPGLRTL